MSQNVEISKEGIKISYVRFMSDSAPGYVTLLLFGLAYSLKLPLPFGGHSWLRSIPEQLSTETKVFLFLLLFLIATPIGIILNGISWHLIGNFQIWLLRLWTCLPNLIAFPLIGTRRAMQFEELKGFFNLSQTTKLYEQANYYEGVLSAYFPDYYSQLDDTRGLRRLLRSLALLALIVSINCFFTLNVPHDGWLMLGAFALLVIFASLQEYYQCLEVLFMVYVLSSELYGISPHCRKQIVQNLAKSSEKRTTKDDST